MLKTIRCDSSIIVFIDLNDQNNSVDVDEKLKGEMQALLNKMQHESYLSNDYTQYSVYPLNELQKDILKDQKALYELYNCQTIYMKTLPGHRVCLMEFYEEKIKPVNFILEKYIYIYIS